MAEWDGTERRAEVSEVADLRAALSEVQALLAEQNDLAEEQNTKLTEIEEKIPSLLPRSRFTGVIALLVLAILLAVLVAVASTVILRRIDADHRRDFATQVHRDRLTSAARGYSNCTGINRALEAVDIGYSALAAQAHSEDETPEEHASTDRAHALLRSGLARSDCESLLANLAPEDREVVRAEASRTLPTLPLPPPPTLGPR